MNSARKIIGVLFLIIFLLSMLAVGAFCIAEENPAPQIEPLFAKAKVLKVHALESYDDFSPVKQIVTLKILNSKFKGQTITVEHMPSTMAGMEINVKEGNKVLLWIDEHPSAAESPDGSPLFAISDFARDNYAYWTILIYALLLVILGRLKGVKALASLLITLFLLFFVLFPLTLKGFNPILITILIALVVSLVTFRIIGGKTKKMISATLGTFSGVLLAGIIALLFGKLMHLSGMSTEEAKILLYSLNVKIDFQGILFSGIIIGALGAIMDVGMSISSAINEVRKVHPEANFKNLFESGMRVGRDIMGTMANTLILAYTGGALPLLLLIIASQASISKVINLELISLEILRAMAGSIGLVLCIPMTAAIAAYLYSQEKA
ncbi:MAG: YibE/F family protein [Candidatus Margulisbacteria bacterium]|nr:YibE/F family protein [Candidatus Margulisiibacteriota bacterium]MBU1021357.1 YibE/F family protein [Candidatus Margulisiibacteriota bacterium]MBU1729154.1 YibE/F family protein [Candidatus Margulisiibacteriota bacterium]MBU1954827.1 YibE/F family protein [Candidatus Margulisiibacteriota bacterium]